MSEILNRVNVMIKNSIIFFLFLSLPVFAAEETICTSNTNEKNIQASTPTSQFEFTQDGDIVTDKKTGLMWSRCPWNYHWELSTCVGDAATGKTSWQNSLTIANDNLTSDAPHLGFSDWRLPNIKEIASIIEQKCAGFAINRQVFGGAGSGVYWSNTHVDGGSNIRVVNFVSGQVTSAPSTEEFFLRLVRDVTP